MDDWLIFFIAIMVLAILGSQARRIQQLETKDMSKKEKEDYFNKIKEQQKKNQDTLLKITGVIILVVVAFLIWAFNT